MWEDQKANLSLNIIISKKKKLYNWWGGFKFTSVLDDEQYKKVHKVKKQQANEKQKVSIPSEIKSSRETHVPSFITIINICKVI